MESILVTGANGYIGAQVCRCLSQQGYRVSGLCYPQIPDNGNWRQLFENLFVCDIRDNTKLKEIAGGNFDAIVHLVSLDHHQSNGEPAFVTSVNVSPAWSLLDIFSKNGLKKFIYFSTIHVYGKNLQGAVTEEYPVHCASPYALTHYLSENICRYYGEHSGVECVVARLSNSYGQPVFADNNCWQLVVNELCRNAVTDKKITLQSDGSPLRDFIHGNDVCRAVQTLLEKGANNGVYHISSGVTYSILELAEKVRDVYQRRTASGRRERCELPIYRAPSAATCPAPDAPRYAIDNRKLQSLGWTPEYTIEHGIEELMEYLEKESGCK